jgi:hypothetical protein
MVADPDARPVSLPILDNNKPNVGSRFVKTR